jgi:RNA polymerase sigma-32 factor
MIKKNQTNKDKAKKNGDLILNSVEKNSPEETPEFFDNADDFINIEELETIEDEEEATPPTHNKKNEKQFVEGNSQPKIEGAQTLTLKKNDETETQALVPFQDTGSFEKYVQSANSAPKLSSEEEWELANRIHKYNDLEAAQKLVFSNLRYVIAIAQKYSGYGLPLPDLVQEGNVGLMRAIKKFQPEKKVKLMSFASHWVRAEIHEFIIKNWRIIKMATTKAQRKLFFKLRSSKKNLDWVDGDEAQRIAKKLDVKVSEVYQMEGRMTQSDATFDLGENDDENTLVPAQYLSDTRYSPEKILVDSDNFEFQKQRMIKAIGQLDERSKEIIQERWLSGNKITLKDLSEKHNVSLERVRQIEAVALKKIKNSMETR